MWRTFGLLLIIAACGRPSAPPEDGPSAIAERLRGHPEGASLLERAPAHRVIFAQEAGITPDGTVRLVRDRPIPESAARYGHLLHHLVHGSPFDDDEVGDCPGRLATARTREREAFALEDRLRASFGLAPLPEAALEARISAYQARCRQRDLALTHEEAFDAAVAGELDLPGHVAGDEENLARPQRR